MLYDNLHSAMKHSMKNKETERLSSIRIIISEVQRDPNKDYSDSKVLAVLASLIKITNKNPTPDKMLLATIDSFMPAVSEDNIKAFIATIDFTKLKNKMAAIGLVKKEFAGKAVDSEMVQRILATI